MMMEVEEEEEGGNSYYRLVPWINWDEWNFVRDSLFSSSLHSIAAALSRISAWRSKGHLSIAIEITASIIEIQQKDPYFTLRSEPNNDASNSEEMLAMLYCMAIMRLVNGVVEKNRKKTEASIAEEADRIGLPRMLIDIRHEASHRDLPSLQLVRLASVKALDWLKSYYWEPQKNAIPFQKHRTANVRKEIKSKVRELAFCLNVKQASQSDSLPVKRKRVKQSEVIYGHNNFFYHKAGKLQGSNAHGLKGQIKRTLRILVGLYSSFPSELVAVLLEFLAKTLDSSDCNDVEPSMGSGVEQISGKSKTVTVDIWKLIITRFSSKEPDLILIMLKALLETIERSEAKKFEDGNELLPTEIHEIEHLSSLVLWLIEKYKKVNRAVCAIQDSTYEENISKATLVELLKKCVAVSSLGNGQLAESALLLAQMIGSSSVVERLKKLSLLSFSNSDCAEKSSCHMGTDYSLLQQESSITKAQEKLDLLRRHRQKAESYVVSERDIQMKESRWRVAKSWKPCPIGMLPSDFHSAGVIPILDRDVSTLEVQQGSESKQSSGLKRCNEIINYSSDTESVEDASKTFKMAVEDSLEDKYSPPKPLKGRLMINGVWKKVGQEELLAIESDVRILV